MSFASRAGMAGNMQTYATDLAARQQAEQLANAINALKLQQGQTDMAGADIAGNAALSALTNNGTSNLPTSAPPLPPNLPSQAPPPGQSSAPAGGVPPPPMPGGGMPQPGRGPQMNPQMTASAQVPPGVAPPMNASALAPPGGGGGPPVQGMQRPPMPPAPMGGAPGGGMPQPQQQQITWKSIGQAIKQQNPQATGKQVMAAIDRLQPMMSAQSKTEWEQFKLQMQTQVKEQGLQQQLQIANQKNSTTERGQDLRAGASGSQADPAVIKFLAEEVAAGNQSILTRQPAATRLAVVKYLADQGDSGGDTADKATHYHGQQAQATSTGRQLGQLEVAGEGFKAIAPEAIKASDAVPRSSWKTAGAMQNWLREQSNDPALTKFQNFNLGLAREYARAMGGTVAAQDKAMDALGTSKDQAAYRAAVTTLQKEIDLATGGGKKALSGIRHDGADQPDPGIQLPAEGGGPAAGAIEDGYRFKGGDAADPKNWEPAGGP